MTTSSTNLTQPEIANARQDKGVWGPGATVGLGLAIFVIYFIAQLIVAVVFIVARIISAPAFDPSQIIELLTNGLVISASIYASAIVGIALTIVFIRARKGYTVTKYLGLRPISIKTALIMLAIVIVALALSVVVSLLLGISDTSSFMVDAYQTSVYPALLWTATVIFAPAFEESFFRGFLFAGFRQSRIGAPGAIILTAFIWAVFHIQYGTYGMATILALGIVLGIVRLKTGSLWSSLIIHSLWNLAAMIELAFFT